MIETIKAWLVKKLIALIDWLDSAYTMSEDEYKAMLQAQAMEKLEEENGRTT